jgi:glycosidase
VGGQAFTPHFSLADADGNAYVEMPAKATGNDKFCCDPDSNDWYETVKLNYGVDYVGGHVNHFDPVPDTWRKMLEILRFWAGKGIDGFRCDMAEMVPCEFWQWAIPQVKADYPGITFVAEVYNPDQYRNYIHNGHFDYLYDKVGLYDTLRIVTNGASASSITNCWQSVDDIHEHMLNFLENHDEQRIASPYFCNSAEKGRPAMIVCALLRENPVMVYFGQELGEPGMDHEGFSGEDGRTTIFDYWSVPTLRRWHQGKPLAAERRLRSIYRQMLHLCNSERTLVHGQFFDLMYVNQDTLDTSRQYAYLRHCNGEMTLIVANFGDQPVDTAVRIPQHALDCAQLPHGSYTCRNLLTGTETIITLTTESALPISIPPHNAILFKLS